MDATPAGATLDEDPTKVGVGVVVDVDVGVVVAVGFGPPSFKTSNAGGLRSAGGKLSGIPSNPKPSGRIPGTRSETKRG